MITYEDAIKRTGEMPTETASLRMIPRADVDILISELFDQQDQLQQRIKDLESQLSSNPLQLTCDGCMYDNATFGCQCSFTCTRMEDDEIKDYYTSKDTK